MDRKHVIIFDEENFPAISVGIKVGIFYDLDLEHHDSFSINQKIYLFTLCYRPKYKDFVRIRHLSLPKRLQERYKDAYNDDQTILELEGIGIHSYRDISEIIERFHEYQDLLVYNHYKNNIKEDDMIYQKMLEVQDMLDSKKLVKRKFIGINKDQISD